PEIGLGTAVLIAVVALTVSVHFVAGLFAQAHSVQEEMDPEELEQFVAAIHRPSRRRRGRR
ncbi:MAG TPA: hypothetical protein VEQ60_04980, partial [Longimicrobium sp.]|nr:hypothetical protein [Longimicrobium sp.]